MVWVRLVPVPALGGRWSRVEFLCDQGDTVNHCTRMVFLIFIVQDTLHRAPYYIKPIYYVSPEPATWIYRIFVKFLNNSFNVAQYNFLCFLVPVPAAVDEVVEGERDEAAVVAHHRRVPDHLTNNENEPFKLHTRRRKKYRYFPVRRRVGGGIIIGYCMLTGFITFLTSSWLFLGISTVR